ncbi:unnamed protein product [Dicrocoelium dendriticum]|nr:unnamed protein product [Dicrocoelium dendriticum]
MLEAERSKVVVVGDSGVGKTALVHLLCKEQPLCNPSYTVGCGLEVKMHLFRGDMGSEKPFFIELWDVGGCNAHANTRSVFYHAVHGLILVYDCTNRKSQLNLRKWLWEVIRQNPNWSSDSVASLGSSASGKVSNLFSSWSLLDVASNVGLRYLDNKCDDVYAKSNHSSALPFPVLVVGTKIDLLDSTTRLQITKRTGEGSNGTACNVPHGSAFSSNHHQVDTQDASSVLMRPHVNDAARQPRTGSVRVEKRSTLPLRWVFRKYCCAVIPHRTSLPTRGTPSCWTGFLMTWFKPGFRAYLLMETIRQTHSAFVGLDQVLWMNQMLCLV